MDGGRAKFSWVPFQLRSSQHRPLRLPRPHFSHPSCWHGATVRGYLKQEVLRGGRSPLDGAKRAYVKEGETREHRLS